MSSLHTELAPKYFTEAYIQHNPHAASGRDAMVAYMKSTQPVKDIEPTITPERSPSWLKASMVASVT